MKKQKKQQIDLLKTLKKLESTAKKDPKDPKNKKGINPFIILFIITILLSGFYTFIASPNKEIVNTNLGLNDIQARYASGVYSELTIQGDSLLAKEKETKIETGFGNKPVTVTKIDKIILPPHDGITDLGFNDKNNPTKVSVKDEYWGKLLADAIPSIVGTIIFVVLLVFLFGRMSGGQNGPMAFIKSRARMYDPEKDEKITFKDVAGAEEEKEDLEEVVDFLRNPKKYKDLGAKIPRGILMVGPPGTGKTLLARAVAGESNVPFFSISGSEFVEMFVGVGAARVRDLFKEAKEHAPSIIFIDEVDAIGKKRSPGIGGGHDEREQTLNQILTEMDGFDNETNVIILAATNRADVLDKALLRPGRFDRKVTIRLPNMEDRVKIFEVHAKNKPLGKDVDLRKIASATVGFSGADIGNLLNEAAILAGRENVKHITHEILQKAFEKIAIGSTKKSHILTARERETTAYHEVGHALVGKMLPNTDPVYKISMIPRGATGGVTWFLPEKDTTYTSKAKFLDQIAMGYGGRVAEEIFFGKDYITTGASSDIESATEIARAMIMKYGFDDELGPENFASDALEGNHLGAEGGGKIFSEKTQEKIDEKVRDILKAGYERARTIILANKDLHEKITRYLLEVEELTQEQFDAFFEGMEGVPAKTVG
ncbi:MAG: ATP-dependent zinc metalloprotease FtsH [Candidatus Gracilibacteria bacterium]|nr:ATP-dependent zinc metalloprotease FtsH [Candidatus Gracilibacteria bacterium]